MATWKVDSVIEFDVTGLSGHPLHLHINPFQIIEVAGNDMGCDAEFGFVCVGDWHDTLQLPEVGSAKFRFLTDTFIGHEVMHCHYLNHEDLGCMTYFEIVQ